MVSGVEGQVLGLGSEASDSLRKENYGQRGFFFKRLVESAGWPDLIISNISIFSWNLR
jgi:hypothetical protein